VAVEPLIPFLNGTKRFAEPCAGDGDLVRHLEAHGLRCVYQGDISKGKDALKINRYARGNYGIITNPPHSRELMHQLIMHFKDIAETWLLLDAEWVTTLQAVPFLPFCSDIVVIGRLKWIPNSKFSGKDSYCWYRFDNKRHGSARIHNQRSRQ
jgi:hypothetical protein